MSKSKEVTGTVRKEVGAGESFANYYVEALGERSTVGRKQRRGVSMRTYTPGVLGPSCVPHK